MGFNSIESLNLPRASGGAAEHPNLRDSRSRFMVKHDDRNSDFWRRLFLGR